MSHLAGGFLRVNLGCPVPPLPLLSCQPGFLLKLLLKVWTQLEEGSVSFSNLLYTAHLKARERQVIWPLPSSNSYSFREPQEVFPALLPALLIWQMSRFSASLLMLPLCPNHHTWALLLSSSVISCSTVTVGSPDSEAAASLCGVSLPCRDPQRGSSAPVNAPENSAATAWGSRETEPMSMLWVLGALNTFQGLVCAMAVSCLIKMTLILSTEVLQPSTNSASPPTPYPAANAWGGVCE